MQIYHPTVISAMALVLALSMAVDPVQDLIGPGPDQEPAPDLPVPEPVKDEPVPEPAPDLPVPEPEPEPEPEPVTIPITNGGFEQDSLDWAIRHGFYLDGTVSHSGTTSLKSVETYLDLAVDPNAGDARASWTKTVYVTPGQTIRVGAWLMTTRSSCPYGLRVGVDFKNPTRTVHVIDGEFLYWTDATGEWEYRYFEGVVPETVTHLNLWLQGKPYDCPTDGWFDDIMLEIVG